MGGHAFANGPSPLSTPRMPSNVYYVLRDHYLQLLSGFYTQTATPIEAPGKTSYGDIDILVSQPKSTSTSAESVAKMLGAERITTISGSPITSFAVPYPNLPNHYVQLDLHLSPTVVFHWQLFQQSHADLWNLLGTTIRLVGLTSNNDGFHVRIQKIEDLNRKRALLFLTCDPNAVLKFLGLDMDAYKRPFESVESMYRYVCGCRFFTHETYLRGKLKANDRKRMAHRELYRAFVEDWLPENAHVIGQKDKDAQLSRDDVLEEALNNFGRRKEYEKRSEEWRKERDELLAKQQGRQKRKEDAEELEEYAFAWTMWLNRNT